MISGTELRRLAGAWNADFTVVERDYVLSWVLAGLYRQPALAEQLVFKGGTALRKCYFPDYRFSADLDFTLRTSLPPQALRSEIEAACRTITEETGLRLVPVDFRTLRDVPGEEAHQGRIEYTGPLGRLGSNQPRVKLDLTIYETLVLTPEHLPVYHPYSDADSLHLTVPVYALDETLAEKLRAMFRRARARDLYDVWQLFTRYAERLDFERARCVLEEKARFKGFIFSSVTDFLTPENCETWARSWEASLRRQTSVLAEYDQVVAEVERALTQFLHTDTLTASRALTHLESLGLLRRSEQRRGPGVYYTLVEEEETPQITSKVTPDTVSQLLSLLRKGKRLSRDETITLIILLCTKRPHTARELAQILNRNADYLRNAYLSPLVREGRLQLTGAPNDPNVAYRA